MRFIFLLLTSLLFLGCEETLYYSNHDYIPTNSKQEIETLPVLEDTYYDYNSSKILFGEKLISKDFSFKIKKIYNKNNSYIQVYFNKDHIENRNILKLYENFYLTKRVDKKNKKFIYSVVKIDNGILTPIHVKDDLIQLLPSHPDHFNFGVYKEDEINYMLIQDKKVNNFKKFLIKSLREYSYELDEYQYFIDFKSIENDTEFIKSIIKYHPKAIAFVKNKEFNHYTLKDINNRNSVNISVSEQGLYLKNKKDDIVIFYMINQLMDHRPELKVLKELKGKYKNIKVIMFGIQEKGAKDNQKLKSLIKKYQIPFLALLPSIQDEAFYFYNLLQYKFRLFHGWAPEIIVFDLKEQNYQIFKGPFSEEEANEIKNFLEENMKK